MMDDEEMDDDDDDDDNFDENDPQLLVSITIGIFTVLRG